jgi:hypothetical protein
VIETKGPSRESQPAKSVFFAGRVVMAAAFANKLVVAVSGLHRRAWH